MSTGASEYLNFTMPNSANATTPTSAGLSTISTGSQTTFPDEALIPSSSTASHAIAPVPSVGMPSDILKCTSVQGTFASHISRLAPSSGPHMTFSETAKWTTSTGPWTSPMHQTPQPPAFADPTHDSPATVSPDGSTISSASSGSINGNVVMLTAIPTVVCVALASAIYFFWRRARRNRWQKNFKMQFAQQASEMRGDGLDSDRSSILRGKEVAR